MPAAIALLGYDGDDGDSSGDQGEEWAGRGSPMVREGGRGLRPYHLLPMGGQNHEISHDSDRSAMRASHRRAQKDERKRMAMLLDRWRDCDWRVTGRLTPTSEQCVGGSMQSHFWANQRAQAQLN